jgi:hypothetical protein
MNPPLLTPPTDEYEFRAIGVVKAIYEPDASSDKGRVGKLKFGDDTEAAAIVGNHDLLHLLSKEPKLLEEPQVFTVYPRTHPDLRFQVRHLRRGEAAAPYEEDVFSVRGLIHKIMARDGQFLVLVERKGNKKPFTVTVHGKLPAYVASKKEFWDLVCIFQNGKFQLREGSKVGTLGGKGKSRPKSGNLNRKPRSDDSSKGEKNSFDKGSPTIGKAPRFSRPPAKVRDNRSSQ